MKEFKGTKGNWKFDPMRMKINGTGDIEGLTVIANVSTSMDYSRGMTTQSANAKLIAAAPELLEALQKLNEFDEAIDNMEIGSIIRKAINKALN